MKSRMSISIIPDFLGFTLTKFTTYPDAVPLFNRAFTTPVKSGAVPTYMKVSYSF